MKLTNKDIHFIFIFLGSFVIFFSSIFSAGPAYAQETDMAYIGLIGEWNNEFGSFNAVDVVKVNTAEGDKKEYYAYCASSKGLVIINVVKYAYNLSINTSIISFLPLDECRHIAVQGVEGKGKTYVYLAGGNKGLYIIDVSNPERPSFIASCDTPGLANGIDLRGNYAYVADGEEGLQIIDISHKYEPIIVGTCDTPGWAYKVILMTGSNYAYVADGGLYGGNGIGVIDITNPYNPILENRAPLWWLQDLNNVWNIKDLTTDDTYIYANDIHNGLLIFDVQDQHRPFVAGKYLHSGFGCGGGIAVANGYAYLAYSMNVLIINVNTRTDPKLEGTCTTPGTSNGIEIIDDYAFIATGLSSMQIIDIKCKKGPEITGSCTFKGDASSVEIDGNYAFVTDGEEGLQIIDISNRYDPNVIASYTTPGSAHAVDIDGNYAYVADGDNGMQIIDITDKINPLNKMHCDTPGSAEDIIVMNDYAYLADGNCGLQIIYVMDKSNPELIGSCDTPGFAHAVDIDGNYAYVADGYCGLQIINISNKYKPAIVSNWDTPGNATGIAVNTNYAYVADYQRGLQVIDVTNKNKPVIVGVWDTPAFAIRVTIWDDYAYVAADNGLMIIDINDKNKPIVSSSAAWRILDVTTDGYYAYVADMRGGLQIIDIRNINGPYLVKRCPPKTWTRGIVAAGDYIYSAVEDIGLQIIDISNSNGPAPVGMCSTPWWAKDVDVDGNYACIVDVSGLQVFNVSRKTNPVNVGGCVTPGFANGVDIDGNYVYVADSYSGLQIIDYSTKSNPVIMGNYDTSGCALDVYVDGNYAYVADGDRGLQIINIKNKEKPYPVSNYPTSAEARSVYVDGNYAYVATWGSGLQIIDITYRNNPSLFGSFNEPNAPDYHHLRSIIIDGNYAYMVGEGIGILHIENKSEPRLIGNYLSSGEDIDIRDNSLFVATFSIGLDELLVQYNPSSKGNLILVGGGNKDYKDPYGNAAHTLAGHVFGTFTGRGYEICDIYYLSPVSTQDIDNDNIPNQCVVDDPTPTIEGADEGLQYAITDWAMSNHLNTGPLYICFTGHGAEDHFQIMPNEILTAQGLRGFLDTFQTKCTRPVVVFLECAASGTFIGDLIVDRDNNGNSEIIVITSADGGPSYISPSAPNADLPISFTKMFIAFIGLLMDAIPEIPNSEDYENKLKNAFITARENFYSLGNIFLDQAPQMYIPDGPIALSLEDFDHQGDPNHSEALLSITHKESLTAKTRYPDGTTITLDPNYLHFLSSKPQVLNPKDPNQLQIDGNQVLIHPKRNGLTTLIAYPDPAYYPNILLTARLPIEVSIPGNPAAGGDKAIIVAGYCTEQGVPDNLWEATNTIANHAYLSLRKKQYSRDDIFYLNPLHLQDVDKNTEYDDIDGYPCLEKIDWAFHQIEQTGAEELLIFLVDHGHTETFSLNPGGESLSAEYLAQKIAALVPTDEDKHVQKNITLLIDACYSGSFIPSIPQNIFDSQGDPNQVIIITSSQADQTAQFMADGLISFSYPFFDEYLLTNSILEAFNYAKYFIPPTGQIPQMSDHDKILARRRDKDLVYYIDEARPVITERDFYREGGKLKISAQVFSLSGIERVWVLITSCEEALTVAEGGPKTDTHIIDLDPLNPDTNYGGWYDANIDDPYPDAFNYQVFLSAKDKTGKVTAERTNINNQKRNTTGAVILVTALWAIDPSMSQAINEQSHRTYRILKEKNVRDEDIYYVKTSVGDLNEPARPPSSFDIENINAWLQEDKDFQTLLIYLIGESQDGMYFKLDETHRLHPLQISTSIDPAGCQVLLFFEMTNARGLLNLISLKPNWVGIASPYTDLPLFSNYFFSRLYCFDTVGEAFEKAYRAFSPPQIPSDYIYFYDFVPTSFRKIRQKLAYSLGNPAVMGEEHALIQNTQVLEDETTITLRLKANEASRIKTPWADLYTPSGAVRRVFLEQKDSSWWEYPLENNLPYSKVSFYAEQIQDGNQPGIIDWRKHSIVKFSSNPQETPYEPNDTPEVANRIVIDMPQGHTFHDADDIDWVYFYGHKGDTYDIEATDPIEDYFIKLSLCDPNGVEIQQDDFPNPFFMSKSWHCPQDGYYTLKVEFASDPNDAPYSYGLSVANAQASSPTADIMGRVVNNSGEGINGLDIYAVTNRGTRKTSTVSIVNVRDASFDPNKAEGWFFIENLMAPGSYKIMHTAKDDPNNELGITYLYENQVHWINDLVIDQAPPPKDPNHNNISGFESVLQKLLGVQYDPNDPNQDSDGDGLTNLEEFLKGTDPAHPTLTCTLNPGLNLFPFYKSDPYMAAEFCSNWLNEWYSIWGYNPKEGIWTYWDINSLGTNFRLEKGKGYLIYMQSSMDKPECIDQDVQDVQETLLSIDPGINLNPIFPIPQGDRYSSYQFLSDRRLDKVQSIRRYDNQEGPQKARGRWEASYYFFGKPAGEDFSLSLTEAYLIEVEDD